MKICMIGTEYMDTRPGGLSRYFEELAQAIRATGQHYVHTVRLSGEAAEQTSEESRISTRAPGLLGRALAYAHHSRKYARSADVLDVHFAPYALLPVLLRNKKQVVIVHFHGPWAAESQAAGHGRHSVRVKHVIERLCYSRADAFVTLSHAFARILVQQYGVSADRVHVIPPSVDSEHFSPGPAILAVPPRAVVVRRLEQRMGVDVLLEAIASLPPEGPSFELVIAGDGAEAPRLRATVERLGLSKKVTFAGRVSDAKLLDLYRSATFSIVPSRALEGFGMITLESMACGTPVIVTDVGGLSEAVAPFDPSLVVPQDDVLALRDRIEAALLGALPSRQQCREYALTFDRENLARRHLDRYARTIDHRS